ncbi:MAG: NAD-dependent epimerase/dehydratase family protein [Bacteroidota bacterium]
MKKQQLLIIGGPHFIGRNLLESLENNADLDITLFNRGKTNADLFPQYKRIIGDRYSEDIQQIAGHDWDYIIDLACYTPASLEKIIPLVPASLKKYIFISTVSVYEPVEQSSYTEDAPLLSCSPEQAIDPNIMSTYGQKKAACERLLIQSSIPYVILRPGLIYGPYDSTDRFYYWMYQCQKRDSLLIPEAGDKVVSFTYVKDLAKAILSLIDEKKSFENIYNCITCSLSIMDIVQLTNQSLHKECTLHHAPLSFLEKENIQYWSDLPLWLDQDSTWSDMKFKRDFKVVFTPLQQSIDETATHYAIIDWPPIKLSGLKEDAYTLLLEKLLKQQ